MKNRIAVLLMLFLLPACACAVTEGVVESAPQVVIDWPEGSGTLFGAWEQGLEDIEAAARSVLEERLSCPEDMKLYGVSMLADDASHVIMGSFASAQEDISDDRISVTFYYDDEDYITREAIAAYSRETGELLEASNRRYYNGPDAAAAAGESSLSEEELLAVAAAYLENVIGVHSYEFLPKMASHGEYWQERTVVLPGGTQYRLHIGNSTGEVLAVYLSETAQEDGLSDSALERRARALLEERLGCPANMAFSHQFEIENVAHAYDAEGNANSGDDLAFSQSVLSGEMKLWREKALYFTYTDGRKYTAGVTFDMETGDAVLAHWGESDQSAETAEECGLTDAQMREMLTAYLTDELGYEEFEFVGEIEKRRTRTRQRVRLADGSYMGLWIGHASQRVVTAEFYSFAE